MKKQKLEFYKSLGLKLTPQRLAIIEYLEGNKEHPSAEDIYNALKPKFPSMSFATVYNTLEILVKKGLIKELNVESTRKRFDPSTHPHHFFCKRCKKVIDVDNQINISVPEQLKGFDIEDIQIIFYGLCSECKSESK
ncbi:Fur family transcriptional regulator [Thermodesulfobacterium hydrogeniphilum]|uniref:Fur family transcriptional regulator n=1 Tax=Thermodesulfobacterium hydrogeniphilum TaxID=161156 RepID=UPI0005715502|nr:Fur family transcriptional regulator [Thermodesulfobacterium hydrogeniphilum]